MLPRLVNFREKVTLIMGTGIQFLDFGMKIPLRQELPGEFVPRETNRSLTRLERDERNDRYVHPANPGVMVKSKYSVPVDDSVKLFDGIWFPVPVLRTQPGGAFAEGPLTWARARFITVQEGGQDPDENTHRVTLAFDTSVFDDDQDTQYLAPTRADVQAGATFGFTRRGNEMGWFTELPWIEGWIRELFTDGAEVRLKLAPEDVESELEDLAHHAHYLNVLALIGEYASLPTITMLSNVPGDVDKAIEVDMVLDVGNSRTCGILIEKHAQQSQEVPTDKYELELRDLTVPERQYAEPFESRVEFAQATFGKDDWARQSGRPDAFMWPTIARVGREAARLASHRRGTEGATGISSPKRYLWDEDQFDTGWRLNSAFSPSDDIEPRATGAPFSNLINRLGEALYTVENEDERIPVFVPRYSRSAMMTFMLAEVLVQALCQINSAAQRQKMPNSNCVRHLKSINLTVPPSMPKPEREIFAGRMKAAMGLVWKAMGWHPEDAPIDGDGPSAWPPFPKVLVHWDESTCAQIVYLFTETKMNFAGRPDEFFRAAARRRPNGDTNKLTIASIDIGGGTTDLVINDYVLKGHGANVPIEPRQRFRDGFKVAGDDILLQAIQETIVPALAAALREQGLSAPDSVLSRLIGADPVDVQEAVLRQQLALQVMYPAGLRVLKEFERYDPVVGTGVRQFTLGELLSEVDPPTAKVLGYFSRGIRDETRGGITSFDLLAVPVKLDLASIYQLFVAGKLEICKPLKALCEIVHLYDCDVLLLTGRPSRLPGVQSFFRALLPLPPDRIVKLHEYRTQNWYPFHRQGRIDDPKTTAAVGAMLCMLGQGRLTNFVFLADLLKPYSTVRYVGHVDQDGIIKDNEVFYPDVDLDDPQYFLPEDKTFDMHTIMKLGYRQLNAERWIASYLYVLDFASDEEREKVFGKTLNVRLIRDPKQKGSDRFAIKEVKEEDGPSRLKSVRLRLNTLSSYGTSGGTYWLDSGSVFEG
ncbi:MAG: virulence factor SrfB [Gammaproteobacteria bacterium]|nr:virulence factor SrfB [Gammaproteobacteria bacterium]